MSLKRLAIAAVVCLAFFLTFVAGAGIGYYHGFEQGKDHWSEDEVDIWAY
jgi:hypothetical protein